MRQAYCTHMIEWYRDVHSGDQNLGARIMPVLPHSNAVQKNAVWEAKNPRGGLKP
jgi:hypothetical protein